MALSHRIHIIGAPGSGKSYLAKKLAAHLDVPHCDLDDIFWDNKTPSYGTKRPEEERNALFQDMLMQPSYVLEGVYTKWIDASLNQADLILVLNPSDTLRNLRLIKRFVLRRLGLTPSKRESFASFWELLKWGQAYSSVKLPEFLAKTTCYASKRHVFTKADDAFFFVVKRP